MLWYLKQANNNPPKYLLEGDANPLDYWQDFVTRVGRGELRLPLGSKSQECFIKWLLQDKDYRTVRFETIELS